MTIGKEEQNSGINKENAPIENVMSEEHAEESKIIENYYYNARRDSERRDAIIKLVCLIIGIVMSLVIVLACAAFFLRADTVEVSGNNVYSDEEILRVSNVKLGTNIYSVTSKSVAGKVALELPFIYSVKVTRSFPNKIKITVFEEQPLFYFKVVDQCILVSGDMKVLIIYNGQAELDEHFPDLVCVEIPDVLYAVVGQKLKFFDSQGGDFIELLLDSINQSGMAEKITRIDASNRFGIMIVYDGRFTVELGNPNNLISKLLFASGIVNSFTEDTNGRICVEDVSKGYAIVNDPTHLITGGN